MIAKLRAMTRDRPALEAKGRHLGECMALALQGALLLRHGEPGAAEAFCASRLAGERGATYGTLPAGRPLGPIVEPARPRLS